MSAPEHIAEARSLVGHSDACLRLPSDECVCGVDETRARVAVALAAREALGFERGRDRAADMAESKYTAWLADPEIRGGTERALTEYANMARDIRAIREPR